MNTLTPLSINNHHFILLESLGIITYGYQIIKIINLNFTATHERHSQLKITFKGGS
jgi:hypothetical protein